MTEFMKRIYDFGEIKNRRDFNGDGVVSNADWNDFHVAWNKYNGKFPCNWAHGDMDQDNDVDMADKFKFQSWYPQNNTMAVHLGAAEPVDALTK
jgi:hypothetical protein